MKGVVNIENPQARTRRYLPQLTDICATTVARYPPLMRVILAVLALSSAPSQASESLFTGKWAPLCQPTPSQEIKNELATVFIGPNWVQVVDMMCNFRAWTKTGASYSASLDCHTEGFGSFKNKITLTPVVDKLRISMAIGKFNEVTRRCGDEWAGGQSR